MLPDGIAISNALASVISAFVAVGLVVLLTRLNGLRSFSKFSSFDFAITVAIGSLLAAAVQSPSSANVWLALLAIYLVQWALARSRNGSDRVQSLLDNEAMLLMRDGEVLTENLRAAKMTRRDLIAKLRNEGVTSLDQVRAVVFESAGTVSVLTGDTLDPVMLEGVRDRPTAHTRPSRRILTTGSDS